MIVKSKRFSPTNIVGENRISIEVTKTGLGVERYQLTEDPWELDPVEMNGDSFLLSYFDWIAAYFPVDPEVDFSLEFEVNFNIGEANADSFEIWLEFDDGVELVHSIYMETDGSGQPKGLYFDEAEYAEELEAGYDSRFRVTRIDGNLYLTIRREGIWFNPFPRQEFNAEFLNFWFYVWGVMLDGVVSIGVTTTFQPILKLDVPQADWTPFAHFESSEKDTAVYSCYGLPPGTRQVTLDEEGGSFIVAPRIDSLDKPTLMPTSLKSFYLEGGEYFVCQDEAVRSNENVGDISITPHCCFLDGSPRDDSPVTIVTPSSGVLTQTGDRLKSPAFLADGYGCGFDFTRILAGQSVFNTDCLEHQPVVTRQLSLRDGRRLVYGYKTGDVWYEPEKIIRIKIALTQQELSVSGVAYNSKYRIRIMKERGRFVEGPFPPELVWEDGEIIDEIELTYPDTGTVNHNGSGFYDPNFSSPAPVAWEHGRFVVEVLMMVNGIGGDVQWSVPPQSVEIVVEQYDGTVFQRIERVYTEAYTQLDGEEFPSYQYLNYWKKTPNTFQQHVSRAFFEVLPPKGDLFAMIYEPDKSSWYSFAGVEAGDAIATIIEGGCFLRTRSVSAVEMSNGMIAFLYRENTLDSWWQNFTARTIRYSVLDVVNKVVAHTGEISLNDPETRDHSVHAFDCVRTKDEIVLFVSFRQSQDYLLFAEPRQTTPFQPVSEKGTVVFSHLIQDCFTKPTQEFEEIRSNVMMQEVKDMYLRVNFDGTYVDRSSGSPSYNYFKLAMADTIRANYNSHTDRICLSMLDIATRTPLVALGKSRKMIEISTGGIYPRFDNVFENHPSAVEDGFPIYEETQIAKDIVFDSYAYRKRPTRFFSHCIDSFSSVEAHDGFIYGAQSEDSIVEILTIDPSLYWSQSAKLHVPAAGGPHTTQTVTTTFKPDYITDAIPVLSIPRPQEDAEIQYHPPTIVDISSHQHYLSLCLASQIPETDTIYYPHIFQCGHFDKAPFEVSFEGFYVPAHDPDFYPGLQIENTFAEYDARSFENEPGSRIRLTLSDDWLERRQEIRLNTGLKFGIRLKATGDISEDKPYVFLANFCTPESDVDGVGNYDPNTGTDIPTIEPPFFFGYAGFEISEIGLVPFYYTETFTEKLEAIPLVKDQVYDLTILAQRNGTNRARVAWIVKVHSHPNDGAYDFRSELISFKSKSSVPLFEEEISGKPETFVEIATTTGTIAYVEGLSVYFMGWGLIKPDTGFYETYSYFYKDEESTEFSGVILVSSGRGAGLSRWREFNDESLFEYTGDPLYGFRVGYDEGDINRSREFHFYNGFTFELINSSAMPADSWEIRRFIVNDPMSAHTSNLQGFWISANDQEEVSFLINSDSYEGELFHFDTVVLTGSNFVEANLLANLTNFEGGEFEEGGFQPVTVVTSGSATKLDTTRFYMNVLKAEADLVTLTARLFVDADINPGRFSDETLYVEHGGLVLKILETCGDTVLVRFNQGDTIDQTGLARVFGGTLVKRFSRVHTASELRLDIPPQETFEGHFRVHLYDIGKTLEMTMDESFGEGLLTEKALASTKIVVGNQTVTNRSQEFNAREFNVSMAVSDVSTWMKMTAMVENLSVTRKPVWVFRDQKFRPSEATLCLVTGLTYSPLIDDSGDKIYEIAFSLQPVE